MVTFLSDEPVTPIYKADATYTLNVEEIYSLWHLQPPI